MKRYTRPAGARERLEIYTEAEQIKARFIPLFEQWGEELEADGERGKLPAKVACECYGCTETSPLALMFTAFCAGYNMGQQDPIKE